MVKKKIKARNAVPLRVATDKNSENSAKKKIQRGSDSESHKEDFEQLLDDAVLGVKRPK
jgi:hypothetical protein